MDGRVLKRRTSRGALPVAQHGNEVDSECARINRPRANTATAHKLARMGYCMLTRGEAFVDQDQQRYEEQQHERSIAALRRRAVALGFQINPAQTPS